MFAIIHKYLQIVYYKKNYLQDFYNAYFPMVTLFKTESNLYACHDRFHKSVWLIAMTSLGPLSLVPLVDLLGKVEEDGVGKVLGVRRDEFLQPLVALLLVLLVQCWHLQGVVHCFDFFHAGGVVATVTCLEKKNKTKVRSTSK